MVVRYCFVVFVVEVGRGEGGLIIVSYFCRIVFSELIKMLMKLSLLRDLMMEMDVGLVCGEEWDMWIRVDKRIMVVVW